MEADSEQQTAQAAAAATGEVTAATAHTASPAPARARPVEAAHAVRGSGMERPSPRERRGRERALRVERELQLRVHVASSQPPKLAEASLRLQELLRSRLLLSKAAATQLMQQVDDIWVEQQGGGYTLRVAWRSRWAKKAVYSARHNSKLQRGQPAMYVSHNLTSKQAAEARGFRQIQAQAIQRGLRVELLCFPEVRLRIEGREYATPAAAAAALRRPRLATMAPAAPAAQTEAAAAAAAASAGAAAAAALAGAAAPAVQAAAAPLAARTPAASVPLAPAPVAALAAEGDEGDERICMLLYSCANYHDWDDPDMPYHARDDPWLRPYVDEHTNTLNFYLLHSTVMGRVAQRDWPSPDFEDRYSGAAARAHTMYLTYDWLAAVARHWDDPAAQQHMEAQAAEERNRLARLQQQ
jgi:hypothetical protein